MFASGNLLKAVSSRLVGVQVGRGASEDCLAIVLPNMEGSDVIRIAANFAEGWDLSFEVQSAGASVGVHGYGPLGWANVSNKV